MFLNKGLLSVIFLGVAFATPTYAYTPSQAQFDCSLIGVIGNANRQLCQAMNDNQLRTEEFFNDSFPQITSTLDLTNAQVTTLVSSSDSIFGTLTTVSGELHLLWIFVQALVVLYIAFRVYKFVMYLTGV